MHSKFNFSECLYLDNKAKLKFSFSGNNLKICDFCNLKYSISILKFSSYYLYLLLNSKTI